jgi:hypothetical protein
MLKNPILKDNDKGWIRFEVTPLAQNTASHYINLDWVRRVFVKRSKEQLEKVTICYGQEYGEVFHLEAPAECETFLNLWEEHIKPQLLFEEPLKQPESNLIIPFGAEVFQG